MKLTEMPEGETFIDANIFIYHFAGASEECKEFLKTGPKKGTAFYCHNCAAGGVPPSDGHRSGKIGINW